MAPTTPTTPTATITSTEPDPADMEAFVGRVAGDLAAVAHAATVVVGDKLGLYGALATREVCTAAGFGTVRRAAETPFNMVLEVRR